MGLLEDSLDDDTSFVQFIDESEKWEWEIIINPSSFVYIGVALGVACYF